MSPNETLAGRTLTYSSGVRDGHDTATKYSEVFDLCLVFCHTITFLSSNGMESVMSFNGMEKCLVLQRYGKVYCPLTVWKVLDSIPYNKTSPVLLLAAPPFSPYPLKRPGQIHKTDDGDFPTSSTHKIDSPARPPAQNKATVALFFKL